MPFNNLPHTTRLFVDYLAYAPPVQRFYRRSPSIGEWAKDEASKTQMDPARRARVADVLDRQNREWGASEQTITNITRLRDGAHAIVTGQQVGLFGGPIFSILKALSAVKLATELSHTGIDCVPVFWLATEDHDLAEVNHITLPVSPTEVRPFSTPSAGEPDAPVSTIRFGAEIEAVVAGAVEALGTGEVTSILRESYRPGETLGSAFARLFSALFRHSGVILLDASDPELHRLAAPIYSGAVERATEIDDALLARNRELESAGYHAQVRVTPESTLLFAKRDGSRLPVHRGDGQLVIGEEKLAPEELRRRISQQPEQFSANVLLRPIVQDYLLPTLAYVGGPAEVAYFAQAAVVYDKLLGRATPVLPRFSATLVEPRIERLLSRYEISLSDAFHGSDHLRELLASHSLPPNVNARFDAADQQLRQCMGEIEEALQKLDPTLLDAAHKAQAKIEHQLSTLRGRAARATLRRSEEIQRHADELIAALYPEKNLQEREIGAIYFLARYGTPLLLRLYDAIQTSCHDHQVVPV